MHRIAIAVLLASSAWWWSPASAQMETEVYIPIGESPGVSGDKSVIGTITDIGYAGDEHQLTVTVDGETRTFSVTSATRYYIDKSATKGHNVAGSFDDCEEGRLIEAYVDDDGHAIWIKIAGS